MTLLITLGVAVLGCLFVLARPPLQACCLYVAVRIWHPQAVTVQLATLDFNTGRIVLIALFVKLVFFEKRFRGFRFVLLDYLMILRAVCTFIAYSVNVPMPTLLECFSGHQLDSLWPYFAFRMTIRTWDDFLTVAKALAIFIAPQALFSIYQTYTGVNPLGFLTAGGTTFNNAEISNIVKGRYGLTRASLNSGQYIGFGMVFALVAPFVFAVTGRTGRPKPTSIILLLLCILGVYSTVSSGPVFSITAGLLFLISFRLRRYWRPFVILLFLCCVFLEFYSNRHFYEVPTRLAFSESTAAYRIGLYHEALGIDEYEEAGMKDHWLFGYGYVGIADSNDNTFFSWDHKDFVSQYIGALAMTGMLGLSALLAVTFGYYRSLYIAFSQTRDPIRKWQIWCLTSSLFGWSIGTLTVGFVAEMGYIFPIFLALAANAPFFEKEPLARKSAIKSWTRVRGRYRNSRRKNQ